MGHTIDRRISFALGLIYKTSAINSVYVSRVDKHHRYCSITLFSGLPIVQVKFMSGVGADGGRLGNKAICDVCQTIVLIRTRSRTWMGIV